MWRALKWVGLALFAPVLLYLIANATGALIPRETAQFDDPGPRTEVLLVAGPIHYDVLLPLAPKVRTHLDFALPHVPDLTHPNAEWAVVGWGSHAFYTTAGAYEDVHLGTIWTAATGDSAVLRIDVAGALPPDLPVTRLALSPNALQALLDAMLNGVTADGHLPDTHLTGSDAFYTAPGRFHLFHTCNQWLGAQLAKAGVQTGVFTPMTWSLRWSMTDQQHE